MSVRVQSSRRYLCKSVANWFLVVFTLMLVALPAGAQTPGPARVSAKAMLLGAFTDDYGSTHVVSDTLWAHGGTLRYRIVKWNEAGQYLIAQNDAGNPSDGNLWTRIDWMPLPEMAPYEWGFCLSAYKAATAEEAEATHSSGTGRACSSGGSLSTMSSNPITAK